MRLGDLDALKKKIEGVVENEMPIDKKWALGLRYALKLIDNAPTVEITEEQAIDKLLKTGWLPKHDRQMTERPQGEWVFGSTLGHGWMKCSNCCVSQSGQTLCWSFCPNCGADMKGGKEE